jgi:hypothetical protein
MDMIPPTELREALHSLSDQFQLGAIADANETLDAILTRIHAESYPVCPDPKCIGHSVFGGQLIERAICGVCGDMSEPAIRSNFVHVVCATELLAASSKHAAETDAGAAQVKIQLKPPTEELSFGQLLKECMGVGLKSCPSLDDEYSAGVEPCKGKSRVENYCLDAPLALAISIVWAQPREAPETIAAFLDLISERVGLGELFSVEQDMGVSAGPVDIADKSKQFSAVTGYAGGSHTGSHSGKVVLPDGRIVETASALLSSASMSASVSAWTKVNNFSTAPVTGPTTTSPTYIFRGLVCYYGLHYVSIFHDGSSTDTDTFLLFDDQRVRVVGDWNSVKDECVRSLYQPVLLLYEIQNAEAGASSPVSISSSRPSSSKSCSKGDSVRSGPNAAKDQPVADWVRVKRGGDADTDVTIESPISKRPDNNNDDDSGYSAAALLQGISAAADVVISGASGLIGVSTAAPLPQVNHWDRRPLVKDIQITYEGLATIRVATDNDGYTVISSFNEEPGLTDGIELLDRIVGIDGVSTESEETSQIFQRIRTVTGVALLSLQSTCRTVLSFRCPHCLVMSSVENDKEMELQRSRSPTTSVTLICRTCDKSSNYFGGTPM